MRYPNALEGVKKIYKAQIVLLVSGILAAIALLVMLLGISSATSGSGAGAMAGMLGGGFLMVVVAVLSVIAFIMNLIGLNKAKPDDPNFQFALYAVIVGIIASILEGVAKSGSLLSDLGDTINTICSFLINWFVCTALISLANNLGNSEMVQKGATVRKLLMGTWCISIVLSVLGVVMKNSTSISILGVILTLISSVLQIIAYILYLKLLSRARTMLEG